jgi:hypothetical protein
LKAVEKQNKTILYTPKSRIKTEFLLSLPLFSLILEMLLSILRQGKRIKSI